MSRWPGKTVLLRASLTRSGRQRYGLTVGLIVLAFMVGGLLGWLVTLPTNHWAPFLIGAIGAGARRGPSERPCSVRTKGCAGSSQARA